MQKTSVRRKGGNTCGNGKKPGPKPKWVAATVEPLLAEMAQGRSLLAVCKEREISYGSVWQAIHADDEMASMYARVKLDYVHARVQEMDEIAKSEPDVQRARLRCDCIKWEAARVAPKDYGDRQKVEHSGSMEYRNMSDKDLDAEIERYTKGNA